MVYFLLPFLLFLQSFSCAECPFHLQKKDNSFVPKNLPIKKNIGGNFLFGDYTELKNGIIPFLSRIQNETNPDIIQLNFPFSGIFFPHYNVVFCPKLAKQILYDHEQVFIKGAAIKPFKKLFAPEGITFMETSKRWQTLHEILQDGPFNPRNFPERYGSLFTEHFENLLQSWEKKYHDTPFDLYKEVTQFTMSVIADAFFNYRMSDNELATVVPAFKFILDYIQTREMQITATPVWIPTKHNRLFSQSVQLLTNFYKTLIKHDPGIIRTQEKEYKTIIALLKEYTDPDTGKHLDKKEIVSHIGTLFFAGHDTTANLIAMSLYQLHTHTALRSTIVNEIQTTYENNISAYIPMGALPTLDLFLQEIIRLYPSAPIITRQAKENVFIGNYLLPKNSIFIIPISHVNRHPDYFINPTTFNPYRFTKTDADYTQNSFDAFIPFGVGSRRCLGQWFALAEARAFIVQLLTSEHELFLTTLKKEMIDLKMTSTGLPNQTIYAKVTSKKNRKNILLPEKNSVQELRMKVVDKQFENDARTIVTLKLEPINNHKIPSFYPGDYLTLYIEKNNELVSARHYSISSAPTEQSMIDITIKYEENGIGSEFVHHEIAINDVITVRMPLHEITFLPKDPNTPLVLISGGIGITPMISIVRYLINTKWQGNIYFIHTSKTSALLPFKKEFVEWKNNHTNIHQLITLSQEEATTDWYGLRGRFCAQDISDFVGEEISHAHIVICGTETMTQNITDELRSFENVVDQNIYSLSFGSLPNINIRTNITSEEVALHNRHEDAWIIIDNRVFDITHYIKHHPGFDIISDYIGTDATRAFYSVAHSGNATRDMSQHPDIVFVGYLKR